MLFILVYVLYVASGTYLCHKSNVAFNYYLHKKFPRVTPVVEPVLGRDIGDFLFCLILGTFAGLLSWLLRSDYVAELGITWKAMWNAQVGKDYN